MNGTKKFHKPNGPAFNEGEAWKSVSGIRCWIVSTKKFGAGKFDYWVTYRYYDGVTHEKDAWSFQVRYQHVANDNIAKNVM